MIEVINLKKNYDKKIAVNNLNFQIKKGQIVGLLGPNGSGKTTTIAMILGLLKPTSGQVIINGKNIEKERIYLLSQMNFISPYVDVYYRMLIIVLYTVLYGMSSIFSNKPYTI